MGEIRTSGSVRGRGATPGLLDPSEAVPDYGATSRLDATAAADVRATGSSRV